MTPRSHMMNRLKTTTTTSRAHQNNDRLGFHGLKRRAFANLCKITRRLHNPRLDNSVFLLEGGVIVDYSILFVWSDVHGMHHVTACVLWPYLNALIDSGSTRTGTMAVYREIYFVVE
jgi:hypothetical protein